MPEDEELKMMLDTLEGNIPEEKVEEKEEIKEEEVIESSEEKEEVEDKKEEIIEPEVKEEVKEPEEDKDAIINELRSKIEELSKAKTEEVKEQPKEDSVQYVDKNFVEDIDLDEVTRDPEEFNKLLNKVAKQTVEETRKSTIEAVLKAIPEIVRKNVEVVNDLKSMHDSFYNENKDLEPFKKVVALVFEDVANANKGKSTTELLKLVAPEVRKRLNLKKEAVEKTKLKEVPKLPSKGGKSGSMSTKPKTEGVQSEIEAMFKSIGE